MRRKKRRKIKRKIKRGVQKYLSRIVVVASMDGYAPGMRLSANNLSIHEICG